LPQRVARKHAWAGAHHDHVRRIVYVECAADAERRLTVRMRQDGSVRAPLEAQLEACVAADRGWLAAIGRLKAPACRIARPRVSRYDS